MNAPAPGELAPVADAVRDLDGLRLLVVHGSRARGEAHATSDWDFGYLADPGFDPVLAHARLTMALGTDRVDLVDLDRAGAVLRYRTARDGRVVLELARGTWADFWMAAVDFWCDAGPIIRAGFDDALERLG